VVRGDGRAEKGELRAAAGDFARACELAPNDVRLTYTQAVLRLASGDREGYRKVWRDMRTRHAGSKDELARNLEVWLWVLAPQAGTEATRPLQLARTLAANNPSSWPHQHNLGAVLYRGGRCTDAVEQLRKAARLAPDGGTPYDWLFLAMAQHRLGSKAQARLYLAKAIPWLRHHFEPGTDRLPGWVRPPLWRTRLELKLLRQEAETLIGK
jgi:tetratricopeptide (TPR) repeat protein